jgi:hypothetical protein
MMMGCGLEEGGMSREEGSDEENEVEGAEFGTGTAATILI